MSELSHATLSKEKSRSFTSVILWVGFILVASAVISTGIFFFLDYQRDMKLQKLMETVVLTDNIYPNIYVGGICISDMSVSEATEVLNEHFNAILSKRQLSFVRGEGVYSYSFEEFSAKFDYKNVAEEAFNFARSGSLRERYDKIKSLEIVPLIISTKPEFSFSEEVLDEKLNYLYEEFYVVPENATISRVDGKFVITNEVSGSKINIAMARNDALQILNSYTDGQVRLFLEEIKPKYTSAQLANAQSLLGTYKTTFSPGDNGRNTNIRTAATKINNSILYPGEVFSTNNKFGPSTYENGYRPAPVIINGKLEDDLGGGVCQVSSTLYMSVLNSELEIVERQNHSLKVSYVDYGFDATLAGDYIDFKFKNNRDLPIIVESILTNNSLTVNIYGHETRNPNRTIKLVNELVEKIPATGENIKQDPSLPTGERKVISAAKNGYRYKVYKLVYEGDKQVSKELINTSYYKPVNAEVLVGTGAVVPNEVQSP